MRGPLLLLLLPLLLGASDRAEDWRRLGIDPDDPAASWLIAPRIPAWHATLLLGSRSWGAEGAVRTPQSRARFELDGGGTAWVGAELGLRAEWLRLVGRWDQGLEEHADALPWACDGRLEFLPSGAGADAFLVRIRAEVRSAPAAVGLLLDGVRSEREAERFTQRWSLEAVGGGGRMAGFISGIFLEYDRLPGAVAFWRTDGGDGFSGYDGGTRLWKLGAHLAYDWLEGRGYWRGRYGGPWIGGRVGWSFVTMEVGDEVADRARAATGARAIDEAAFGQFDGRLGVGWMWQDGLRGAAQVPLCQLAVGVELAGSVLLDTSETVPVSAEVLRAEYDLSDWSLQLFVRFGLSF